jgi:hypothetical protein
MQSCAAAPVLLCRRQHAAHAHGIAAELLRHAGQKVAICVRAIALDAKRAWSIGEGQDDETCGNLAAVIGGAGSVVVAWFGRNLTRNLQRLQAARSSLLDPADRGLQWRMPMPKNTTGDTLWPLLVEIETSMCNAPSSRGLAPADDDAQVLQQWLQAADAAAHTLLLLVGAWMTMGGAMDSKDGRLESWAPTAGTPPMQACLRV